MRQGTYKRFGALSTFFYPGERPHRLHMTTVGEGRVVLASGAAEGGEFCKGMLFV